MKKILIFDNLSIVKSIKNKIKEIKNADIVCLHYSIQNYLNQFNINSKHLFDLYDLNTLEEINKSSEIKLNIVLNNLDSKSESLKEILGLEKTQFFYNLFKSRYYYIYPTYLLLSKYFDEKLKSNNEIIFYFDENLSNQVKLPIINIFREKYKNKNIKFIKVKSERNFNKIYSVIWFKNFINYFFTKFKIFNIKLGFKKEFMRKKSILILNYDFDLLQYLKNTKYKKIFYSKNLFLRKRKNQDLKKLKDIISKIFNENENFVNINPDDKFLIQIIFYQLKKNLSIYFDFCSNLKICNSYDHVIWRYPVIHDDLKSLLLLYCLKKNINVIGFQHGAHYIENNLSDLHFDQDFNKCNFWISYRLTENDYFKTYGKKEKKCKIISSSEKFNPPSKIKRSLKRCDNILYPIRPIEHATHFFSESNICYQNQKKIIEYLDKQKKKYYIKLISNFSNINCWNLSAQNKVKYANFIKGISLRNYYKYFNHNLIILDSFETSLYETIDFNPSSEIYLLNNLNYNIDVAFLNSLSKNVKIFQNIDSFLKGINDFNFSGNNLNSFQENSKVFSFPNYKNLEKVLN